MPGGFSNPIVAGLQLLIQAIRSPNYVTGVSGWTINKDGSAEFNNLTIRGVFNGTDFILNSAGLFLYSGTPAAGNLILSLASVAGSDAFGNAYIEGLGVGQPGSSQIELTITGGSGIMYFVTGNPGVHTSGALQAVTVNSGAAESDVLQLLGAQNTTQADSVLLAFLESSTDGTTQPAEVQGFYRDPLGSYHKYLSLTVAGMSLIGAMVATEPGTGTRATPAVAETWHTASLASGWTSPAGYVPIQYQVTPHGTLHVVGVMQTTSATPPGTFTTLPAGWRPSTHIRVPGAMQMAAPDVPQIVDVANTGALTLLNGITASGVVVAVDFEVPI